MIYWFTVWLCRAFTVLQMSSMNVIDLSSDDEVGEVDFKAVKVEPDLIGSCVQQKKQSKSVSIHYQKSKASHTRQGSEENGSSSALSTARSSTSVLDQEPSQVDDANLCSTSSVGAAPLCRQFWKTGNYENVFNSKSRIQNGTSYLHIHPKFLHSNATSHKWAFGAVAELLDNAVDEIQNGATFAIVDKTSNPRDGSLALLIQDDGGGMDPDTIRHCLSFGFSDKKSKSAIGKYGNGFKTSTMRLGADVIIFSRHMRNRKLTQSIGLLSYTFLTQTGLDRIVVPMVDYEFDISTGTYKSLLRSDKELFVSNLSMLLRWSPCSTETELLKQFDDIGSHGTKIIIYNLWLNDEGTMELDFDSDPEDIRIFGEAKSVEKINSRMAVNEQHIANRLRYSLRAYLSVLYLRIPESFCIILRGRVIEYHNIACDLKFPEFILYKPQGFGGVEGKVVTSIGFLKEAPYVNIHGFNVYHKNRLILPFWRVVNYSDSRGRGVVGVLEANFIEPTHNKQDFEKTSVFQKLEVRLKEMTWEYWDYHCGLIGYQVKKKQRALQHGQVPPDQITEHGVHQPVVLSTISPTVGSAKVAQAGGDHQHRKIASSNSLMGRPEKLIADRQSSSKQDLKRKERGELVDTEKVKRNAGSEAMLTGGRHNKELECATAANQLEDPKTRNLMLEHQKLHTQCLEHKKKEEELSLKVAQLRSELGKVQREYDRLVAEAQLLERVKEERNLNI